MKKDDKVTIMLFFIVILLIILLIIYHDYENRSIPIDRKVDYIFDKFPSENVLNVSKDLFLKAIEIYNTDNLSYEGDDESFTYYSYGNYDKYKKIIHPEEIDSIYTKEETNKYKMDKHIYSFNGGLFIEDNGNSYNKRYVGSIIALSHWDEKYAYFDISNYYCDNYNYMGILNKEPDCNYQIINSTFKATLENDNLVLSSYNDIKDIIK